MRCDDAAKVLTELAEGGEPSSDKAARHIGRCLRCQAQLAQHRRVRRSMGLMRARTVEPAPGLLTDILASLEAMGDNTPGSAARHRHVVAYVAAVTAATAAGAAGVIVLTSRGRRDRIRSAA